MTVSGILQLNYTGIAELTGGETVEELEVSFLSFSPISSLKTFQSRDCLPNLYRKHAILAFSKLAAEF